MGIDFSATFEVVPTLKTQGPYLVSMMSVLGLKLAIAGSSSPVQNNGAGLSFGFPKKNLWVSQ